MHDINEFNEYEGDMNAVAWHEARFEATLGHARRCKARLRKGVVFFQEQENDRVLVLDAGERGGRIYQRRPAHHDLVCISIRH